MEKPRFFTDNVITGIVITCIVLFVLAFVLPSAWAIYSFYRDNAPILSQEQREEETEKESAEFMARITSPGTTTTPDATEQNKLDLLQPIRTAFIESGVLPKDTAISRVHALANNRYIATLERTDQATDSHIVELWLLEPETKNANKISEFKSLEAGLSVSITANYYNSGTHISFVDAWEGWHATEDVYLDQNGVLIAKTNNANQLDFVVTNAKGETIKITSDGQTCAGRELTNESSETSSSLITKLLVNGKPVTLKKPFTMNCSRNDLVGVYSSALFTEATISNADNMGYREIRIPLYQADQSLFIGIDKSGTMFAPK